MRRIRGRLGTAAAFVALAAAQGVPAAEPAPRSRPPAAAEQPAPPGPAAAAALFAQPAIAGEIRIVLALVQAGELATAGARLDALIARYPDLAGLRADRAAVAMRADDTERAMAELTAAAGIGFPELAATAADPLFAGLTGDPRLAALLARPAPPPTAPPVPAPARDGVATVTAGNTGWNPASERLEPRFILPEKPSAPVLADRPKTAAYELLREHFRRGRAAGNLGDLYDNRDRGHSTLDAAAFPQLTRVAYDAAARAADLDYGLNDRLVFGRTTFGNSSTAITGGALWRSLPRLAMTQADGTGPLRLWQNAAADQLYVYPAHRDYGEKRGDLFPANTPYILISRGSSGSDRPLLEAVAMILAAFRPDTKARLAEKHLVVPTVQMVFRRSLQTVQSRADYFSGLAHPAAFDGFDINLARMVSLANSIEPDAIPAEARIRVLEEDLGTEGVDYFGAGLSEQLFDTPAAVARIWRSKAGRRSMLVSATDSRDPNGRALSYEWHLLQGDPERVTIEPIGDGAQARITLDWQEPFAISEKNPTVTARVDIGLFVNNGVHDSAPAILSWYFPPQEARTYALGPDGSPRVVAIDHADPARAGSYADPMLIARADWRDDYAWGPDGRLLGWTRHRAGRSEEFTADGRRVLGRGPDGAPLATERVAYPPKRLPNGTLTIEEVSAELPPG